MVAWQNPYAASMYQYGELGELVAMAFKDQEAWLQQSGRVVNLTQWNQTITGADSGSSTTYTAYGSSFIPNLTFTKENSATKLEFLGSTSAWMATTTGGANVGVAESHAGNVPLGRYLYNTLGDHRTIGLTGTVAGGVIPAGTVTLSAIYHVDAGTQVFNVDTNDQWQLWIAEVW